MLNKESVPSASINNFCLTMNWNPKEQNVIGSVPGTFFRKTTEGIKEKK
jgi:hypothetical protein